jgi:hypothetical protein
MRRASVAIDEVLVVALVEVQQRMVAHGRQKSTLKLNPRAVEAARSMRGQPLRPIAERLAGQGLVSTRNGAPFRPGGGGDRNLGRGRFARALGALDAARRSA